MLIPIINRFLQVSLARKEKLYKNRLQGPILPNTKIAIRNAIANRWLLRVSYEGDNQNAPGSRYVEPYVWGLSRYTGNDLLRVYQYAGDTTTIMEGWKTFRLDRIRATNPLTTKKFNKARPLYNYTGDLDFNIIIAQVSFDNV
jgi:hypothetical protein